MKITPHLSSCFNDDATFIDFRFRTTGHMVRSWMRTLRLTQCCALIRRSQKRSDLKTLTVSYVNPVHIMQATVATFSTIIC